MKKIEKILVACDLSPKASETLGYAANLAKALHAKLTVVHVVDSRDVTAIQHAYGRMVAAGDTAELETHLHELRQEAFLKIQALMPKDWRNRRSCHILVRQGQPHTQIVAEAVKHGADLVIIGDGRHGLLAEHILGTTAGRLLRELKIPMISLRGVFRAV
jgi:universal stress protein A